jgi:phosphoribosyl-ATP pyrophosphohydrolase
VSVADQPRYAPNTVGEEEFVQAVSDMAREVWDFHNRWGFGSGHFEDANPANIIDRRNPILAEEVRELAEAVDDDDTTAVCNEAADVLFVAIGHIEALGTQGLDGVRYVTTKNANKTAQTHAIRQDTGKLLPKEGKPHKWE